MCMDSNKTDKQLSRNPVQSQCQIIVIRRLTDNSVPDPYHVGGYSAISCDTAARLARGVLTYKWYASLSQRPNILIKYAGTPAAAAADAAPMRKLCPEYPVWSMLAVRRVFLTIRTNWSHVSGEPSA